MLIYPLKLKELIIFEANKPTISIIVFGYDEEGDEIFGHYTSLKMKIQSI